MGVDAPGHGAAQLSGGVGGGLGALGFDEVDDGLGLAQIHPPVEEGPLGEPPRARPAGRRGRRGPPAQRPAPPGSRGSETPLCPRRCRSGGPRETVSMASSMTRPRLSRSWPRISCRSGTVSAVAAAPGREHRRRPAGCNRAGEPHDADGADDPPGGHRGNDIGHENRLRWRLRRRFIDRYGYYTGLTPGTSRARAGNRGAGREKPAILAEKVPKNHLTNPAGIDIMVQPRRRG